MSEPVEAPYVVLKKRVTLVNEEEGTHRLQVWVGEVSDDIPAKIFVNQLYPDVPDYTEQPSERFAHVASFADLAAFPPDEPDDRSPFYRVYWYDILFETLVLLEETWTLTEKHVQILMEDIHRVRNLPPVTVTTELV